MNEERGFGKRRSRRRIFSTTMYPRRNADSAFDLSNTSKIANLDREKDDEKIVKAVKAAVEDAESSTNYQRFVRQFIESWEFYKGQQWLDEDLEPSEAPSWRFRATRNITFSTIRSIEGLLMDARPVPYIVADFRQGRAEEFIRAHQAQMPYRPNIGDKLSDEYIARRLTDILHAEYERRDEEILLGQVMSDCVVAGLGVRKITWDTKRNRPAAVQVYPPDVLIDPYCSDHLLDTAKYIVFRKTMDVEDLQHYYNVSKSRMRKIVESAGYSEWDYEGGLFGERKFKSPFRDGYVPKSAMADSMKRMRVDVYEMWFFGTTLYELEHEQDEALEHPFGRNIIVAGDELLLDQPNPYPHGLLPFVFFRNYGDPRDPYGFGDVLPIRGDQVSLNVVLSQIVMNLILMANSQWVFEEGALLRDWLTNQPGLAIEVPRGMINSIRKIEGTSVPPQLFQLVQFLEQSVKNISNINETVQGAMPQTHTPAIAISASQNAALVRIREKAKLQEAAYRKQAYMEIRNMQEFAVLLDPLRTGELDMGEWLAWDERMRNLVFDIQIESKVGQPANLMDKLNFALQLMQTGAMDALALIDYVELPIDERYRRKMEIADEIQMLQAELMRIQLQAQLAQVQQQSQQPQQPAPPQGGQAQSAPQQQTPPPSMSPEEAQRLAQQLSASQG